jgi:hypothetical protein
VRDVNFWRQKIHILESFRFLSRFTSSFPKLTSKSAARTTRIANAVDTIRNRSGGSRLIFETYDLMRVRPLRRGNNAGIDNRSVDFSSERSNARVFDATNIYVA